MLYFVGAWLLLLAVSVPAGLALLRWTQADIVVDRPGDRFVLSAWLGLLALGGLLLVAALFVPLSPGTGALLALGVLVASLSCASVRALIGQLREGLTVTILSGFLALVAGVAVLTAQPVVFSDTGAYHTGAIHWLSDFGAVEGIALVYYPLGFVSSWFALAAPFNPDALREHAVAVMGGFAMLLLTLHAVIAVARAWRRKARTSDWFVISGSALLLPVLAISQKVTVSPEPNFAVTILIFLVGWSVVVVADRVAPASGPRGVSPGAAALPLLLALGAMTVKQQAGPAAAIAALFYLWRRGDLPKRIAWSAVLGLVCLSPIVIYDFVATGCLAYPMPTCTSVSWSVGNDFAKHVADVVQTFGRYRVDQPTGSGLDWVRPWLTADLSRALGAATALGALLLGIGLLWARQTAKRLRSTSAVRRFATWVTIAGSLVLFACLLRVEEISMVLIAMVSLIPVAKKHPASGWLLAMGLGGVALDLYAAPDPGFAIGYTAILLARFVVFQAPWVWAKLQRLLLPPRPLRSVGVAALLAAAGVAAALGPFVRPTTSRTDVVKQFGVFIPPPMPSPPITITPTNSISYRVPEGAAFCWNADLPCTRAYELNPSVVLRHPSDGIESGFARESGR